MIFFTRCRLRPARHHYWHRRRALHVYGKVFAAVMGAAAAAAVVCTVYTAADGALVIPAGPAARVAVSPAAVYKDDGLGVYSDAPAPPRAAVAIPVDPAAVPEPSSLAALMMAVGGLAVIRLGLRWRRR